MHKYSDTIMNVYLAIYIPKLTMVSVLFIVIACMGVHCFGARGGGGIWQNVGLATSTSRGYASL